MQKKLTSQRYDTLTLAMIVSTAITIGSIALGQKDSALLGMSWGILGIPPSQQSPAPSYTVPQNSPATSPGIPGSQLMVNPTAIFGPRLPTGGPTAPGGILPQPLVAPPLPGVPPGPQPQPTPLPTPTPIPPPSPLPSPTPLPTPTPLPGSTPPQTGLQDCAASSALNLSTASDFRTLYLQLQEMKTDPCYPNSHTACAKGQVSQQDSGGKCACMDVMQALAQGQCEQQQQLQSFCSANAGAGQGPAASPGNTLPGAPSTAIPGSNFAGQLSSYQYLMTQLTQAYLQAYQSIYKNPMLKPAQKAKMFQKLTIQKNWIQNQLVFLLQ